MTALVGADVIQRTFSRQVLREGDLISIDCGAITVDDSGRGWHGDAAITVPVAVLWVAAIRPPSSFSRAELDEALSGAAVHTDSTVKVARNEEGINTTSR